MGTCPLTRFSPSVGVSDGKNQGFGLIAEINLETVCPMFSDVKSQLETVRQEVSDAKSQLEPVLAKISDSKSQAEIVRATIFDANSQLASGLHNIFCSFLSIRAIRQEESTVYADEEWAVISTLGKYSAHHTALF